MGTSASKKAELRGPNGQKLPKLPAELQADIDEFAKDGYIQWQENSTSMQKINQELEGERWHNDPDFAQGQEEFMVETYNQADHESKGYLTQEEFKEFYTAIQADGGKRGIYEDPRESKIEKAFELANRINEERDGVSFEEWIMLCYAQVAKT